ncbi:hypothetical protein H7J51_20490 [Mycobacterium crocinum]|uniref:Uncharacterized protein n=1 Tax=Mycolicibacterium crocinum TaxID=388459 RepID=A0ABY3TM42_9MYCO|nr:hypothetical protein [Mycolicibacterium crocinum]MCV7217660.1 hypothetical protein [Mycolicibacterium crocinum]ULN42532.1 hypothetical protein MI149_05280 [Mycolicibacterium crocinum]
MTRTLRLDRCTHRLAAIATAGIVAAGVLSAPIAADVAVPRHPSAIQVHTFAVDLTAVAHTTAAGASSHRSAAAVPELNFAPPTPQQVVATVGVIAVAAAWYAAFPVTVPLSVGIGVLLNVLVKGVSMQKITIDPVFIVGASLASFVLAPYFLASPLIALTAQAKTTSASAQANSTPVAQPSSASQSSHRDHGRSGTGGSRRNANSDRVPSAHRAAKGTATPGSKKHARTAGSGRSVSKERSHE